MVSAVCVGLATIGLIVYLITMSIASVNNESLNKYFGVVAGGFSLLAFLTLFYAILLQIRARSRTVRNRILMSIVMIVIVGVSLLRAVDQELRKVVLPTNEGDDVPGQTAVQQPVVPEQPGILPEDTSLYKPGWYGEKNDRGIQYVFTSFAENAKESRDFNKRLPRKVAYGVLSVVNRGNYPVVIPELRAEFVMDSQNSVPSTPVRPLLAQLPELNRDILARMKEPLTIKPGEMFPDLPICHKNSDFPWAHVKALKLRVGLRDIYIPGRMVSASEKQLLMESPEAVVEPGLGMSIAPIVTPPVTPPTKEPSPVTHDKKDDFSDL